MSMTINSNNNNNKRSFYRFHFSSRPAGKACQSNSFDLLVYKKFPNTIKVHHALQKNSKRELNKTVWNVGAILSNTGNLVSFVERYSNFNWVILKSVSTWFAPNKLSYKIQYLFAKPSPNYLILRSMVCLYVENNSQ